MALEAKTLRTPHGSDYTVPGPWKSLAAVKRANKAAGKVFFDRDKGPALKDVRQGRFIVTADRDFEDELVYHLNAALDDGRVYQVGEVIGYKTVESADAALVAIILDRPELSDVDVEPGPRSRPSELTEVEALEWASEQEAEQESEQELDDDRRARELREMTEDPLSDLYYSDGGRVLRQDGGIDR